MNDDYDSPWKIVLERFFQDFLAFFFPEMHNDIDWQRGYENLDIELQKIVRDAEAGNKRADKLIKVWRCDGEEQIVLIHIEVQGRYDRQMAERMFVYYYRLLDKYQKPIVSLAILGDNQTNWRPTNYQNQLWGCSLRFDFPTIKLLDYQSSWNQLEASNNPFAWIVMTHLKTTVTRDNPEQRLHWKFHLVKLLYNKGYKREDVLELFRFLDWLLALPKALDMSFQQQLINFEANMSQQYISALERRAIQTGLEQGIEQGLEQGLNAERLLLQRLTKHRFGALPAQQLAELYQQINDTAQLADIGEWILDSSTAGALEKQLRLLIGSQES